MRQVVNAPVTPFALASAAAFRRLLRLLRSSYLLTRIRGGSSILCATCRAPGPWLMILPSAALRAFVKAVTRSGGAFVIPHDTCRRIKEHAVRDHSRPHRARRHGAGGACDTLSLHWHHLSGTVYPEIIIILQTGNSFGTSLPPPISSRIYPSNSNGVGLRLETVHGQTLQIKQPDRKAMHYLHALVLTPCDF
jgi:hypothetical protein